MDFKRIFKTDWLNRLLDRAPGPVKVAADHNRFTTLGLFVAVAFFFTQGFGCTFFKPPTTANPLDPTTKPVTHAQIVDLYEEWENDFRLRTIAMEQEAKTVPAKFNRAVDDIDRQMQQRKVWLAAVEQGAVAMGLPATPFWPLVSSTLGIAGAFALADNARKGFKISNLQAGAVTVQDVPGPGDTVVGGSAGFRSTDV